MAAETSVNVLMVSLAFQGHINPMLNLAERLISKGVNVTIATTEEARHRTLRNPNSQTSKIRLEFFSDGLSVDFDRSNNEAVCESLKTTGSKNLSDLITSLTKADDEDYSCVIVSPFCPWAIDVAAEHGIPCALLWIQASAVYSIYYRHFNEIDAFPNLGDPNEKVNLPGLPSFEVRDLPTCMLSSCPNYLRGIVVSLYQSLGKVRWVLGTSFYEAEEEVVKSMASLTPIHPIGPLVSPFLLGGKGANSVSMDLWNADGYSMKWLDSKPPSSVVYVSFGSFIILSRRQIESVAVALKNSNKAFLWVLNPADRFNKEDCAELSQLILDKTSGGSWGLVVKWCPQERVLMHPAVACFVSHCGWNSTLETMVAGVPVVACPHWTDQPLNAMLVESVFRNGVRAQRGEDGVASAEEIERCIWEVTEGPDAGEMKKRAFEMKELAREALREGGTSDNNVNRFISQMIVGNTN